jgi:hypothetical protein
MILSRCGKRCSKEVLVLRSRTDDPCQLASEWKLEDLLVQVVKKEATPSPSRRAWDDPSHHDHHLLTVMDASLGDSGVNETSAAELNVEHSCHS